MNGGFEQGTAFPEGWTASISESQTIEATTDISYSGDRSVRITTPSDAESWPALISSMFEVQAGKQYRYAVRGQQEALGAVQILLRFYDGSGNFVLGTLSSGQRDSEGQWTEISGVYPVPEGAVTAEIRLQLRIPDETGPSQTLTVFADNVSVREVLE